MFVNMGLFVSSCFIVFTYRQNKEQWPEVKQPQAARVWVALCEAQPIARTTAGNVIDMMQIVSKDCETDGF